MKYLTFPSTENEIYPNRQLAGSFFISKKLLAYRAIEVMPLTPRYFLYAISRNSLIVIYWFILRQFYKAGFIDIPEADPFEWKYWRFNFWSVIRKRNARHYKRKGKKIDASI